MILKGNQRGGAKDLALHLTKDENEHVEVHELRGFAAQDLMGALNEAYAVSRGTRCKQFLYSLALNPPPGEKVGIADFEAAIDRAEERLGLAGQPRAIVFHEKKGRRHAHVVWSRIDVQKMRAVQMSFDHDKLMVLSRELFIEHQWRMPAGLADRSLRNPRNFTLEEYQQARRADKDPKAVKAAFQDAWAISDSAVAFSHAMEERGYRIARGDRRGYVAVDYRGEVYSIPKWAGLKTKEVRARLDNDRGEETTLSEATEVKRQIAADMLPRLEEFDRQIETEKNNRLAAFEERRRALVKAQRENRQALRERIAERRTQEALERQGRYRKGLSGLWDYLRGETARIRKRNEREADAAELRDRAEMDALIFRQLGVRRHLSVSRGDLKRSFEGQSADIAMDIDEYRAMRESVPDPPRQKRERRAARGLRHRRGPTPEV